MLRINSPGGVDGLTRSQEVESSRPRSFAGKVQSTLSSAVFGLAKTLFSSAFKAIKSAIPSLFSPKQGNAIESLLQQTRERADLALRAALDGMQVKFTPHLGTIEEEGHLEDEADVAPSKAPHAKVSSPESQEPESTDIDDDGVDLDALVQQMNANRVQEEDEEAPWEIKNRIVRPSVESKVQPHEDLSFKLEPPPSKSALKSQTKSHDAPRQSVKWSDQVSHGKLVSDLKEIEKKTPFELYSPEQKKFTNIMTELEVRTTPEKGTHGFGFSVLGKTELDKGKVWNPDQFIAQNERTPEERAVFDADLKRLLKGEITPKDFVKKHTRS
jgi:hypothetical protein